MGTGNGSHDESDGSNGIAKLTPRELEVVALIAEGCTNAEIAERLVLSTGTVSNHVAHIMRALGVKNRVKVAMWAVEHGLRAPRC